MRTAEELSQMIVDTLCLRKGFEDFWFSQEDSTQEEILEELQDVINEWDDDLTEEEYQEDFYDE